MSNYVNGAPPVPTHPHPYDGVHEGLRRDCDACEAEDVFGEDDPTVQHEHPYADEWGG